MSNFLSQSPEAFSSLISEQVFAMQNRMTMLDTGLYEMFNSVSKNVVANSQEVPAVNYEPNQYAAAMFKNEAILNTVSEAPAPTVISASETLASTVQIAEAAYIAAPQLQPITTTQQPQPVSDQQRLIDAAMAKVEDSYAAAA